MLNTKDKKDTTDLNCDRNISPLTFGPIGFLICTLYTGDEKRDHTLVGNAILRIRIIQIVNTNETLKLDLPWIP
jgi:hypothetical protein